jgi:hypothetical protein
MRRGRNPLRFLVHATPRGDNIANELGRADYSYFFVLKYFLPVLERIGVVVQTDVPATRTDDQAQTRETTRHDTVQLLFMPPHQLPEALPHPTIPVFAWEYSTIPSESWGGEERHDWRKVLRQTRGAITHSEFAAEATRTALGRWYPICSLPAPLWNQYAKLCDYSSPLARKPWSLRFDGVALDSQALGLDHTFEIQVPSFAQTRQVLSFSGVVYTAVFNPNDERKNFYDLLSAFVWSLRDTAEATLVVKLVHHDAAFACRIVLKEMQNSKRCRSSRLTAAVSWRSTVSWMTTLMPT